MKHLSKMSVTEKGMIKAYHEAGKSNRWIGNKIHRNESSIRYYLKNGDSKKRKPGPKTKISPKTKRLIIRKASNKAISTSTIKDEIQLNVSKETIRRVIRNSQVLKYQKMMVKPPLKLEHKLKRLQWAKTKVAWGDEWKQVIWSDEKKFNLDGPDAHAYYWHDLRKEDIQFSRRHTGGGSLMIWACFNFYGKSKLAVVSGILNQWEYQTHLKDYLLPFIKDFGGVSPVFQQDNCRCHVARSTMEWLKNKNIEVMDWPPYSPDLNPIENLWGVLVRKVYAGGKQFKSIDDLQSAVIGCWEDLDQNILQNLVNSMPNRIYETIYAHGSSINY